MIPAPYPPGYADDPPDRNLRTGSEIFNSPDQISVQSDSFVTPPSSIRSDSVPPPVPDTSIGAMKQKLKQLQKLGVEKSQKIRKKKGVSANVADNETRLDKKNKAAVLVSDATAAKDEGMNIDSIVGSESEFNGSEVDVNGMDGNDNVVDPNAENTPGYVNTSFKLNLDTSSMYEQQGNQFQPVIESNDVNESDGANKPTAAFFLQIRSPQN